MKVSDRMTRDVRFARPDGSIRGVARNMGEQQVRRLPPVVSREERQVGILSPGDAAVGEGPMPAGDALAGVSRLGGAHPQTGSARAELSRTVAARLRWWRQAAFGPFCLGAAVALGAALAVSAGAPAAVAQPAAPAVPRPGSPTVPPERVEPAPQPPPGAGPTGGDIDDSTSGIARGVLRPPAGVDPGIQAPVPVPNPGTTPVIPPPGTPGGDPSVVPR